MHDRRRAPEAVTPRDYAEIDVLKHVIAIPANHRVIALELIRLRDLLAACRRNRAALPAEVLQLLEQRIPDPPDPDLWRELLNTSVRPDPRPMDDIFATLEGGEKE